MAPSSLRLKILPRNILEFLPFIFLVVIIPLTYWFEIWVVLPSLYPLSTYPGTYTTLFVLGHYLLFNIVGNLLGVLMNDTSIRGRIMPSCDSPNAAAYCDECKSVTPARSYHCPICKICILRRDHHCLFTACCIGLYNYRYFLMFLFHMLMAILISVPYNFSFLWDHLTFSNFASISKAFFPAIIVFLGFEFTKAQGYLLLWVISLLGVLFISAWFYFHLKLAMSGKLVHELRRNINLYDSGLTNNLKEVLGERWYLVWASPFLQSSLTSDGISFKTKAHIN